jgi:hypothetical protein
MAALAYARGDEHDPIDAQVAALVIAENLALWRQSLTSKKR